MTTQAVWQDGWYRFAHALASPNHGPRPAHTPIDLLVIHAISLPPGVYGGTQVQAFFTNQLDHSAHPYFETLRGVQVSAHFYIRRTGDLIQFVSCDARAWHAGESKHLGRSNCNDFSIGIELEGIDGDQFTSEQYESLTALLPAIAQHYPVKQVCGHEHIAPGRKKDPGEGFNWPSLQAALGWDTAFSSVK